MLLRSSSDLSFQTFLFFPAEAGVPSRILSSNGRTLLPPLLRRARRENNSLTQPDLLPHLICWQDWQFSGDRMRYLLWIALAVSICVLAGKGWAQTSSTPAESSSTFSTTPADLPDDQAFSQYQRVTKCIKPPKAISAPDPKFPDLPADAEDHGTVVMLIGISAKGRVEVVRVLRSDEQAFEKSAVTTVKKWNFKPAEKDGHALPVQITVEMKFQK